MPIYQGTHYSVVFAIESAEDETPIDITGWEFSADFRDDRYDPDPPLLSLTTAGGGFTVFDGLGGRLKMDVTAAQSLALPLCRMSFDVLRTDIDPGPIMVFSASVPVATPVTRD